MIMPNLTVKDVDASVAFYRDQLGFTHDMTLAPEGQSTFAIVRLGSQAVIGVGVDDRVTQTPYAPGVQFMIYLPAGMGIDDYYAQVSANGVTIDEPLADTYWGDRAFSLHDPDGYLLTFCVTIKQMSADEVEANMPVQREA
ncbi:MAG TPA: VOC family protein [Phototrophicaceae bacterium]|nr:VOC family protein [Phototrophicaceae bacterium]